MEHKAYEFDWVSFEAELLADFEYCIRNDDPAKVLAFISDNIVYISDPYEGDPLDEAAIQSLRTLSVQEILDYSLTKYYSVETDIGLGDEWLSLEEKYSALLLGSSIKGFDPGLMGSYFQSPSMLEDTLTLLKQDKSEELKDYVSELEEIKMGLYVTF